MEKIEIYHNPGRNASVDDLLATGLKSANQLIKEGKIKDYSWKGMLPDHTRMIYFEYLPSNTKRKNWVSIEVNPEETFIYNKEFRAEGNFRGYMGSRMLLSKYLERLEKNNNLKNSLKENETVLINGRSFKGEIVKKTEKRFQNAENLSNRNYPNWFYLNEVIMNKDIIPPSEFKNHSKAKSD